MARRRTKKQKIKTSQKRTKKPSSKLASSKATSPVKSNNSQKTASYSINSQLISNNKKTKKEPSLLRVDSAYLKSDLLRSLIITTILILSLIGIFIYLRYN